jgi:hypothetical protein
MGFQIEDGAGKGNQAKVDKVNRLWTMSTIYNKATHAAGTGNCYFWTTSYIPSAGDTILWLSNLSTIKYLAIETIHMTSDTITRVTVHRPVYTAPAGTLITGINSNFTLGNLAPVLCYSNETNNTQGDTLIQDMISPNDRSCFPINGSILLGYNDCIAIDFVSTVTLAAVTIVGFFGEEY